ncbi:BatD family protein [Cesiribacter andamanensis]|uniref:BatD family protein n=1 Tax=Cesiribacter andamanensis TaxID=649507 RepID=UPI000345BDF0|nr:BatD family protein [Cesiribacter andamanensis]
MLINFFLLFCGLASAQEIAIELGTNQLALNEPFTISLVLRNAELESYSAFPDVPGFDRAGTSTSSSTQWVNGRMSREMRLVQSYLPREQGSFRLRPFRIKVNGEYVDSDGTTLTVGPPRQPNARQPNRPGRSLFDDLFGVEEDETIDYREVEDNAFLGVTVDKKEVFVGEGFTITVAFYIPEKDPQVFAFYDLNNQLTKIIQQLKPENCWEENFQIYEVKRQDVVMEGERYGQYKLYQARYYPLNVEPVKFPGLELQMIKYKLAQRRSFFGPSRQESYKTFSSQPLEVRVKDLPPHPLKEQLAVGDYQLKETVSSKEVQTGESFSYNMSIVGQGNIAAITAPQVEQSRNLTIYEPNESINTRKTGNTVIGVKQFSYYAIPNEPGEYALRDYFRWIYFNPRTARYDTLRPTVRVAAIGASRKNESIMATDPGAFYDKMNATSNDLDSLTGLSSLRWLVNGLIFLMFAVVVYLLVRK